MQIRSHSVEQAEVSFSGCPAHRQPATARRTACVAQHSGAPIECDADGVWHVRGYSEAREILRDPRTRQAGFKAELIDDMPQGLRMRPPLLYQEGKEHQLQRKQTARFFTPRTVSEKYRALMENVAERLLAGLQRAGRADLSAMSMAMAVHVASEVIGLTNSRLRGLDRRLSSFFSGEVARPGLHPVSLYRFLRTQSLVLRFFLLDVQPAIKARRREPREDVISHLIRQGYRDNEILTECLTYAAAGMVTTREFICVAAWHMLEQPALRDQFLAGSEEQRLSVLHELLRLEPVVGHLYRRSTAELHIASAGVTVTIPAGALIDIHVYAANADERVAAGDPLAIRPGRELHADRAAASLLGFGDGHHRCPGSYLALQETDVFLQRLLALPTLHVVRAPTLSWNDLSKGYELRNFLVAVG